MGKIGVIIQARMGSSRLSGKILKPFYEGETILSIVSERLMILNIPIIIATSTNIADDQIEIFCNERAIKCFRGSENDVLERFIDCAFENGLTGIIRVCSDNPFLDMGELKKVISFLESETAYDYVSYWVNESPSINTHFGFWAEYVSRTALTQVQSMTQDNLYREHVTNYIYAHPELFKIHFLTPNSAIKGRNDIRLTIDTPEDFNCAREIYRDLAAEGTEITLSNILSYIDHHEYLKLRMRTQISKNSK